MTFQIKHPRPIHPFADFNENLLKTRKENFDNPISQLLAKHLIFEFQETGKFLPIPFPTGIGKTHNLIVVIHEAILQRVIRQLAELDIQDANIEPNALPQFVFITNSVNNVKEAYDKLCHIIETDARLNTEQKIYLKNQLVYSPNISTSLKACLQEQCIQDILDIFEISNPVIKDNLHQLSEQIKTLEQSSSENHMVKKAFEDKVDEVLRITYQMIFSQIVKLQNSTTAKILTNSQIEQVAKLIPAIKMQYNRSQAIFLTTKKFLYGVHQSRGKYHFVNDMGKHSLIIDEIDRQNNEILSHLVEVVQIDILSKAKTIHSNLGFSDLCHLPKYKGIAKLIAEYAEGLASFITEHHLHLSFNMDDELSAQKCNPLLFSDKLATHLTNIDGVLYLAQDIFNNQNIIYNKDKAVASFEEANLVAFTPFLNQLDQWANKRFNYVVMSAIELYKKNASDLNESADDTSSQEAIASILHQLNLYDLQNDIRKQLQVLSGRKHPYQGHDGTYHTRGISLIEIDKPHNTKDSVVFYHHGFEMSPSGMLASYVEQGATIVGISATATSPSVIHNFDTGYLEYRLGEQFIRLEAKELQSITDYYHKMRCYADNGITLHTPIININLEFFLNAYYRIKYPNHALPDLTDPISLDKAKQEILTQLNLVGDGSKEYSQYDYQLEWLSKLCQAIEQFYHSIHQGNRYMMAMLNRFVKNETKVFLEEYIEYLDQQYLAKQYVDEALIKPQKTYLFARVNAQYLKTDKFDDVIRTVLNNTADRVIVLTTYQTLSSGANPDYPFATWESNNLSLVAPVSYAQRTDIDTMYLEKCTHIISADDKPHRALESRLTLLAQGMALQEAGQLSNNALYKWTKTLVSYANVETACLELKKTMYNTKNTDYIAACCRDIEQAIGRSNRTAYKRPHIYLMYDHGLVDILAQDVRLGIIVSHEYKALVISAKQRYKEKNENINSDKPAIQLNNLAQKLSARTNKHINTLLKNIQEQRSANTKELKTTIANWSALRKAVAIHPNLDKKPEYPNAQFYLELPNDNSGYVYTYESETNFGSYQFFNSKIHKTRIKEVSERDCKLNIIQQNPIIRDYFESKGYAIHWSVNTKYVMTPPMFNNIYKGFLGEAGGTALLENYGFEVNDLPLEVFEIFDNILTYENQSVWIDFKHWDQTAWGHIPSDIKQAAMEKFTKKIRQLSQLYPSGQIHIFDQTKAEVVMRPMSHKLIICNLMDDIKDIGSKETIRYYDGNFIEVTASKASILTISGLIDSQSGATNLFAINALKQWLTN